MCFSSGNTSFLKDALKPKPFWEKAESLHDWHKSVLTPEMPPPPQLPAAPQGSKSPDTAPLKRRNANSGGFAVPAGSTLLSGPTGVSAASMNLGSQTLLGGG
jgi:hypothetical protein